MILRKIFLFAVLSFCCILILNWTVKCNAQRFVEGPPRPPRRPPPPRGRPPFEEEGPGEREEGSPRHRRPGPPRERPDFEEEGPRERRPHRPRPRPRPEPRDDDETPGETSASRKMQENPDSIGSTPSSTLRRAARVADLRAGLSEKYELPTSRFNRTIGRKAHRADLYLGDSDAPVFGHVPDTDLSVLDPPRTGYPVITRLQIQERDPIPAKRVDPEELANSVTEALELGREDFNHIVMKKREPRCIIGNYGPENIHPLIWSIAEPITHAQYGYTNEFAAIRLSNGYTKSNGEQLFSTLKKTRKSDQMSEENQCNVERIRCDKKSPYRTFDGTCNNLEHKDWGAAKTGQTHVTFAAYEDGISSPRELSVMSLLAKERRKLPSAREVSISLSRGQSRPDRKITMMTMQLAQWIAHDIVNTPIDLVQDPNKPTSFTLPACCDVEPSCRHPVCDPIAVPPKDPFYGPFNVKCLEFIRAQPANSRTCELGPRTAVNLNSHYLDGSGLYGSRLNDADKQRAPGGLLKINDSPSLKKGYVLAWGDEDTTSCHAPSPDMKCIYGGDGRVNQHTGVVSMMTLFTREHNRIASFINEMLPDLPDGVVFMTTRRILVAEYQHIIYNELLPVLVGNRIWRDEDNGLVLKRRGYCTDCYKTDVNPSISPEFSTIGFRLHTLISDWLPARNASGWMFPFYEHMLNPAMFYRDGITDEILTGMVKMSAESFDQIYSFNMQNMIFRMKNLPYGEDLFSMDIQRARDMGVPSYLDLRAACGLPAIISFEDMEDWMPPRAVANLARIYKHVLDVDGMAGALSEYPVNGGDGVVGPTMACLIVDQFARLRQADRFWYENKEAKFTGAQLAEIRKVSLAAILCGNTPIGKAQPRVLLHDSPRNPVTECEIVLNSAMNLQPFLEGLTPERFPNEPAEVIDRGPPGKGPGPGGPGHGPGGPGGHGPGGHGPGGHGPGGHGPGGSGVIGPGAIGPGAIGPGAGGPGVPFDGPPG